MGIIRKTALIDGDIVVFRCSAVFDNPTQRVREGLYRFDEATAVENAKAMCRRIVDDADCIDGIICFSSPDNFRKAINPKYKSNRTSRKPIVYQAVKDALVKWSVMRTLEKPGLEGDDVMGILATGKLLNRSVICSIDKDMLTIPGLHLNFDDEFGSVVEVTPEESERNFLTQVITGDRTDGYPGADGYGPVKAERFFSKLETEEGIWNEIVEGPFGGDHERALENARCARILRDGEFDYKTREPILWSPST